MALGTFTIVESAAAQGPVFVDRCTVVGDTSYPNPAGSEGILAALRAAKGSNVDIISLKDEGLNGDYRLEYKHDDDTLHVRVISTGAEVGNGVALNGVTFGLVIVSK